MIFLTYDFVWFALIFLGVYALLPWPAVRLALVLLSGLWFQLFYGGISSVVVVIVLAAVTYAAALTENKSVIRAAIVASVGTLLYCKYMLFLVDGLLSPVLPAAAKGLAAGVAPAVIPLGISFFTFEFVHYLVDVHRGSLPVRSLRDFGSFVLFWPTMISGPIKRYQKFIPALHEGIRSQSASDAMHGVLRVAIGFLKKWAADNLTGWIDFIEPQLEHQPLLWRWIFLAAIAARILLDFSGYSDMAIGYARIMGITVPENFNWPYLARSPVEFWQRWHMSLSLWIRDYVYIPLGGNRFGTPRRIVNALIAMTICGLWHGAAWNFAVWGLYHGVGLAAATGIERAFPNTRPGPVLSIAGWGMTMLFACLGWLLFFYPVSRASAIALMLVTP
jgi:alginate O-acetyltransferase complex protein AlgI